jgi:hypothetical protein
MQHAWDRNAYKSLVRKYKTTRKTRRTGQHNIKKHSHDFSDYRRVLDQ